MESSREKSYEEGSVADFAHQAVSKIQTYADSDDPQKNLIGLNALLFVFVTGFIIAYWLSNAETIFSLTFFVVLVVSLVFAAVLTLGYLPLLDTVNSFGSESLNGLRLAILLEFLAFTSVFSGLLFQVQALVSTAFLIIVIQLFVPLIGDAVPMLDADSVPETPEEGIWDTLGRLNILIGIGTFIFNLLLLIIEFTG